MNDFMTLPDSGPFTLANLTVPACLADQQGDLVRVDLGVVDGQIAGPLGDGPVIDMKGALALPCFTDMHTHLDKGHIWPRSPNPDGTFLGALTTVRADSAARWSGQDVAARMEFSLSCAYAHGTAAIRTHLDSMHKQPQISWPVFAEARDRWAGRIDLQAACLVSCEYIQDDGLFETTADIVADHGGVLGMVSYPVPDLKDRLLRFFRLAADRGLSADFHVDETMDPSSETLRLIAETALEIGFDQPIIVGHCCSLSTQDIARALETLDIVAKAGLHVVSLPMCNLYLQDRQDGTPRHRGITLVHEMKQRGINVSFASDNTRDPFYAYGDLDMVEVMREATRIGHLDHSAQDWVHAFTSAPRVACGFGPRPISARAPADLVITRARSWTEFFARPQSDRIVLRGGRAIDRALPDYADLDHLMGTP